MRRRFIIGLIVLNGLVAAALFVTPADSQIIPRGLFNCCKSEATEATAATATRGPGGAYCCSACCWFYRDCRRDADCEAGPQT